MMFLRCTHVVGYVSSFPFSLVSDIWPWLFHHLFAHSLIHGPLGRLQFHDIIGKAAMNILVRAFLYIYVFISFK